MLAVLDIISIADIDGGIDLVLQLWTLRYGGNFDGLVNCRINGGVLEKVSGNGG